MFISVTVFTKKCDTRDPLACFFLVGLFHQLRLGSKTAAGRSVFRVLWLRHSNEKRAPFCCVGFMPRMKYYLPWFGDYFISHDIRIPMKNNQ